MFPLELIGLQVLMFSNANRVRRNPLVNNRRLTACRAASMKSPKMRMREEGIKERAFEGGVRRSFGEFVVSTTIDAPSVAVCGPLLIL